MFSRRAIALASRAAIKRSPLGARSVHVEASTASLQTAIKNESVLVFSKTYCPHCARVKALFEDLKIDFELVELDTRPDGADIQAVLLDLTKQRTVPNVFIKGQHIGGCDSTFALHDDNKLLSLLK